MPQRDAIALRRPQVLISHQHRQHRLIEVADLAITDGDAENEGHDALADRSQGMRCVGVERDQA
jgi:hypothetical protein